MASKRRILRKLLPGTIGRISYPEGVPSFVTEANGWQYELTNDGNFYVFFQQSYFDLSGYTKEQETTFPAAVAFQEMEIPYLNGGTKITTVNYVTKKKVTVADLTDSVGGFPNYVGMPSSRFNLEEIFTANLTLWRDSLDFNSSLVPGGSTQWGVGDATSGEKIYITRAFYLAVGQPAIQQFEYPPCAVVMPCIIDSEEDLEYIMRLKRSYEMAE